MCYCSYNVEHAFKTLEERASHEEQCPQREEMERKYKSSQAVYQANKNILKNQAAKRKT
jgi:hypothetical protein